MLRLANDVHDPDVLVVPMIFAAPDCCFANSQELICKASRHVDAVTVAGRCIELATVHTPYIDVTECAVNCIVRP